MEFSLMFFRFSRVLENCILYNFRNSLLFCALGSVRWYFFSAITVKYMKKSRVESREILQAQTRTNCNIVWKKNYNLFWYLWAFSVWENWKIYFYCTFEFGLGTHHGGSREFLHLNFPLRSECWELSLHTILYNFSSVQLIQSHIQRREMGWWGNVDWKWGGNGLSGGVGLVGKWNEFSIDDDSTYSLIQYNLFNFSFSSSSLLSLQQQQQRQQVVYFHSNGMARGFNRQSSNQLRLAVLSWAAEVDV